MATSKQIRERIESLAQQLVEEFGDVDETDGDCWLDAVENQAVNVGDALATALLKARSQRRSAAEEPACPQCGKAGRYVGDRQRELISRRGPVTITEPEHFCPCCRKAFFPDDHGDRR
jgi:hypothetical protein